ncbi:MAG: PHP domain-containing protein [Clostridiales bacterium]|nr:PHP domain-containing protein [Clostridiales bacterium]
MAFSGRIDLHMHTTISDGTDTPEELLSVVKSAGITHFSITDHDAVAGAKIMMDLLSPGDPLFIPGVEFSCKDDLGKYHILGYGFDPSSPSILKVVEKGHENRMTEVRARIKALKEERSIVFPKEENEKLMALPNPGKPHIGNLMVKYGYAESRKDAITGIINKLSVKSLDLAPEKVIDAIKNAGGVSVLAHPAFGSGTQKIFGKELESRVDHLIAMGLQGIEAYYSTFTKEIRDEVLLIAEKRGLLITCGSDYHGNNKTVRPGEIGTDSPDDYVQMISAFLKAVIR